MNLIKFPITPEQIIKIFQNDKAIKVIEYLEQNPTDCNSQEISMSKNIIYTTTCNLLRDFEAIGLVSKRKEGLRRFYNLNQDTLKQYQKEISQFQKLEKTFHGLIMETFSKAS